MMPTELNSRTGKTTLFFFMEDKEVQNECYIVFLSADKPDNVSLNISTTKVCAGVAVVLTCSAGAANPAVRNYTLYKFVEGFTFVSSNRAGVFIQKLHTKGQHSYRCEGSNSLASTSSTNRSLEVHCEFGIEHL